MLTEAVLIALIVATPTTLAAIASMIVSLRTRRIVVDAHETADRKLDHITVLTNSTLSAANERIRILEAMVKGLLRERDTPPPTGAAD